MHLDVATYVRNNIINRRCCNMGDFNVNGSSLSHALRGVKPVRGSDPDQFDEWYKKVCF